MAYSIPWAVIFALFLAFVVTPMTINALPLYLMRYLLVSYAWMAVFSFVIPSHARIKPQPFSGQRIVHLDMKGAPLTVDYFKEIIPVFQQLGATGVMIEWESTFPFEDVGKYPLSVVTSDQAYTKEEIQQIIAVVYNSGLKVIPFIQSFGFMNYILKHDEFKHLRQQNDDPNSFHPMKSESQELMKVVINQVMSLHEGCTTVHLGAGEVFDLGLCSDCSGVSHAELFLAHMTPILEHVNSKGLKPLIWDDMLTAWPDQKLRDVARLTDIAIWKQGTVSSIDERISYLKNFFANVWGASAFKGASSPDTDFPPINQYYEKVKMWAEVEQFNVLTGYKLGGFILTGNSRFTPSSPLCELLPSSIPSLAMGLAALKHFPMSSRSEEKVLELVGMKTLPVTSKKGTLLQVSKSLSGFYPGGNVFPLAAEIELMREDHSLKGRSVDELKAELRQALDDVILNSSIEEYVAKLDKLDNKHK